MTKPKKNPAAVALGRLGGSAPTKKPKGFAAISKRKLREIAQRSIAVRQKQAAAKKGAAK